MLKNALLGEEKLLPDPQRDVMHSAIEITLTKKTWNVAWK